MSTIPGETPRFIAVVDRFINIGAGSGSRIDVRKAPITVEVDAHMKACGCILPGFVFGCRSADGVFVSCTNGAADGSGIPAGVAYKDSVSLLDHSIGDRFNFGAVVQGWTSPIYSADQFDSSWGATSADRWKALTPLLRFARLLPVDDAILSNAPAGLVEVKWTDPRSNVLVTRGGAAVQHGPGSQFTLPKDIADRVVAEGLAVYA